jgi:hypothetical protein
VVLARLADRQHQQDRLAHQPPRDHAEHLTGRVVQPLCVVHQHDERLFGRHLRKDVERGQTDHEAIRWRTCGEAERHPQGLLLVSWHRLQPTEEWSAELVERCEGQLQLRLDTGHPEDPAASGPLPDVPQERGLAYPCLAAEDEHHALPPADPVEAVVQHLALAGAPAEVRPRSGHCASVGVFSGLRNLSLPPGTEPPRKRQVVGQELRGRRMDQLRPASWCGLGGRRQCAEPGVPGEQLVELQQVVRRERLACGGCSGCRGRSVT